MCAGLFSPFPLHANVREEDGCEPRYCPLFDVRVVAEYSHLEETVLAAVYGRSRGGIAILHVPNDLLEIEQMDGGERLPAPALRQYLEWSEWDARPIPDNPFDRAPHSRRTLSAGRAALQIDPNLASNPDELRTERR